MSEDNDAASKTEEPTPRKLEEARRKGDVAKSMDLPQFASFAAAAGVLMIAGAGLSQTLMRDLLPFVSHPDAITLEGGGANEVMRAAAMAAAPAIAVVLLAAGAAGAAGNLVQHGFLWSPDKIAPKFEKISPMKGLKRLFGLDGFVQFLKSLAKIAAMVVIAWMVLKPRSTQWQDLAALDPSAILPLTVQALTALTLACGGALGVGALLDWLWQRHRFMQRMKMSREELKEDFKQSEGDPHIKAKLRQMRAERSRRRMMQAVPTATVVVMNPTHFAVALRYEQGETLAPVCVAKGVDSIALKIREVAEEAGVAVVEDPPLARALFATVEIDRAIPAQHYQAVAKVIGFVLGAGKARAGRGL